jgi:hypothetical protein
LRGPRPETIDERLLFLDSHILFCRQWRGNTPVWEDSWEMVQYAESDQST